MKRRANTITEDTVAKKIEMRLRPLITAIVKPRDATKMSVNFSKINNV